jgi:hypothetical protein
MRQTVVNLVRGHVVKALVRTLAVVIVKPLHQPAAKLAAGIKCMQVKIVVFYSPPEPFDKDVVHCPATIIHTGGDTSRFKDVGKEVCW